MRKELQRQPLYVLVRHGLTAPQQQGRYCGHSDPPLSSAGVTQMRRLANDLARRFPKIDAVVTSDLVRATASAALLTKNAPTLALPELREIDFGAWEGLRFEETGCGDAEALRSPEFRFPGGESAAMVHARVSRAVPAILAAAGPITLIVAHAGSLAMLACLLRGNAWERYRDHMLPHGGMSAIMAEAAGA